MKLTYRFVCTVVGVVAYSGTLGTGRAIAQVGTSYAIATEWWAHENCEQTSPLAFATTASCAAGDGSNGSVGTATTTQDGGTRSISAHARLILINPGSHGPIAYSQAFSTQYNQFDVLGSSAPGDMLLFHFRTDGVYAGSDAGSVHIRASSEFNLTASTGVANDITVLDAWGSTLSSSDALATSPTGFRDYALPFSAFTGLYHYNWGAYVDYDTFTSGYGNVTARYAGTLDAISVMNSAGHAYATVDFDAGVLDLTATPEPASLLLLVTGLLGIGVVRRHRRVV